jgi:hypothetical protein
MTDWLVSKTINRQCTSSSIHLLYYFVKTLPFSLNARSCKVVNAVSQTRVRPAPRVVLDHQSKLAKYLTELATIEVSHMMISVVILAIIERRLRALRD